MECVQGAPCSCDAPQLGIMPELWQLLPENGCRHIALPCCVSPWQGKSVLTTKICLKILLSDLADGQSRVLQGVIKLNSFEHVPRKTSRLIQLCRGLVSLWC